MGHNHVLHPHSTEEIFANTYFILSVKEVKNWLENLTDPFYQLTSHHCFVADFLATPVAPGFRVGGEPWPRVTQRMKSQRPTSSGAPNPQELPSGLPRLGPHLPLHPPRSVSTEGGLAIGLQDSAKVLTLVSPQLQQRHESFTSRVKEYCFPH